VEVRIREISTRHTDRLTSIQQEVASFKCAAAESAAAAKQAFAADSAHQAEALAASKAQLAQEKAALDADTQRLNGQLSLLSREHHAAMQSTTAALARDADQERARAQALSAALDKALSLSSHIHDTMHGALTSLDELHTAPGARHPSKGQHSEVTAAAAETQAREVVNMDLAIDDTERLSSAMSRLDELSQALAHRLSSASAALSVAVKPAHLPAFPPFSEQERTLRQTLDKLVRPCKLGPRMCLQAAA
jgi:chromosome segregation ATPase